MIDLLGVLDRLALPTKPGQNASIQTNFSRRRWDWWFSQPRFSSPVPAGFLFMKHKPISLTPWLIGQLFKNIQRVESGCWEWVGSRIKKTGAFSYGILDGLLTHRIMWTHVFGSTTLHVLHQCDNPPCCNPFHLKAGDQARNMRDMADRLRGKRGTKRINAKLTEEKVIALRQFYRENSGPQRIWKYRLQRELRRLGVNITTAHRAATGRTWRHVPNPYKIVGYRRGK